MAASRLLAWTRRREACLFTTRSISSREWVRRPRSRSQGWNGSYNNHSRDDRGWEGRHETASLHQERGVDVSRPLFSPEELANSNYREPDILTSSLALSAGRLRGIHRRRTSSRTTRSLFVKVSWRFDTTKSTKPSELSPSSYRERKSRDLYSMRPSLRNRRFQVVWEQIGLERSTCRRLLSEVTGTFDSLFFRPALHAK